MDASNPSDSSSAVSLAHAAIQRLAGQSATCKVTSAVLSGAAMLFASGRTGGESLLFAAAPVGLLAFADASYAARAKGLAEMADQLDSARPPKAGQILRQSVSTGGFSDAGKSLAGLLSLTVWPYYTSLALLVAGLAPSVLVPKVPTNLMPGPFPSAATQMPAFSSAQPQGGFPAQPQRTFAGSTQGPFNPGTQAPANPSPMSPNVNRVSRFPAAPPALPGGSALRPPGAAGTNGTAPPSNLGRPPQAPTGPMVRPPAPPPSAAPVPVAPPSTPAPAATTTPPK